MRRQNATFPMSDNYQYAITVAYNYFNELSVIRVKTLKKEAENSSAANHFISTHTRAHKGLGTEMTLYFLSLQDLSKDEGREHE